MALLFPRPTLWSESEPEPLPRCAGPIAVITCYFNPAGFKNLRRNYDQFAAGVKRTGAPLYTAELAIGDQEFTIPHGPNVFRLRSNAVLWHKESLLNAVEKIMPAEFTQIAFVDCDFLWEQDDWLEQASMKLERLFAVQCFRQVKYLGADGGVERLKHAAAWQRQGGSPGGAWAVRRELFTRLGGLYELITGGGDAVATCLGFLGERNNWLLKQHNPSVQRSMLEWAAPVFEYVRGRIGYIERDAIHLFHGAHANRQYSERIRLLDRFNSDRDLERDENGLLKWSARADPQMISAFAQYFRERKEDE